MKWWFKKKSDYFVSFAHGNGFGCCVMTDIIVNDPRSLHDDFAKAIKEKEGIAKVVILNWVKL